MLLFDLLTLTPLIDNLQWIFYMLKGILSATCLYEVLPQHLYHIQVRT